MSNWWNVIKQNKLVNLPKFKVKPFNTAKPNEEDRECKDKIMEIANFTKNFQLPNEIAGEFVKVKEKHVGNYNHISYGSKKLNVKIHASVDVLTRDPDNIPEEVYCRLLDMLSGADFNFDSERNVGGTDYQIMAVKRRDNDGIKQHFEIRKKNGGLLVWVSLDFYWPRWISFKEAYTNIDNELYSTDTNTIDWELNKLADEMRWPI